MEYEKKYLLKFEKPQAEIKRLVEQQKQIEFKELKERISRRLKLEKESGKDYTIYLKNKFESKLKSKTTADDTRNFIRKRREKQQLESELVEEDVQEKASIEEEKKRDENRKMSITEKLLAEAEEREKTKNKISKTTKKKTSKTKPKTTKKKTTKAKSQTQKKPMTEKVIKSRIKKLEGQLNGVSSSTNFIQSTLKTAVAEKWTKKKTIEELRKSEEKITIRKAQELVNEAFNK